MAKKEQTSARTSIENVNEQLSSVEQRLEHNKKYIYYALAAVVALIAAGAIFMMVRNNGIKDAQAMVSKADIMMLQGNADSALVLYKRAADNSSYAPASRAAQMAASMLYAKGKTDEAIKYLEMSSFEGKIEGPAAKSLLGDCYVNKKQYDKAVSCYNDAIKMAGDNEQYTPMFMKKKATVLHATKKFSDELAVYEDMKAQYPSFAMQMGVDKYIERAKAAAGE